MGDMVLGCVGVLVAVVIFVAGLITGVVTAKKVAEKWIEDKGCYLCQEGYKHHKMTDGMD